MEKIEVDKSEIARVNALIGFQNDLIGAYNLYYNYVENNEDEYMLKLARNEIMAREKVLTAFKAENLAKKMMK